MNASHSYRISLVTLRRHTEGAACTRLRNEMSGASLSVIASHPSRRCRIRLNDDSHCECPIPSGGMRMKDGSHC
jgi:hypothetical protein